MQQRRRKPRQRAPWAFQKKAIRRVYRSQYPKPIFSPLGREALRLNLKPRNKITLREKRNFLMLEARTNTDRVERKYQESDVKRMDNNLVNVMFRFLFPLTIEAETESLKHRVESYLGDRRIPVTHFSLENTLKAYLKGKSLIDFSKHPDMKKIEELHIKLRKDYRREVYEESKEFNAEVESEKNAIIAKIFGRRKRSQKEYGLAVSWVKDHWSEFMIMRGKAIERFLKKEGGLVNLVFPNKEYLEEIKRVEQEFVEQATRETRNLLSNPETTLGLEAAFSKIERSSKKGQDRVSTLRTLHKAAIVTDDNVRRFSANPLALRAFLLLIDDPRFFRVAKNFPNDQDKLVSHVAGGLSNLGAQGRRLDALQNEFSPNPRLSRQIFDFLKNQGFITIHTERKVGYLARGPELTKIQKTLKN